MKAKTLYDKLWDSHVVSNDKERSLIYIDRHLLHEVTSPQAFAGLKLNNRKPWRLDANFAVPDHNIPTLNREAGISDPISKLQVETLQKNCKEHDITLFDVLDKRQGIVHIVGPEQGATLPGMTIVCGDSHTSTHGALAALAFGIGTSEVEHVLATQCLIQKKMKRAQVQVTGQLPNWISSKDIALALIGKIGTAGGSGYALEFAGNAVEDLSIEARMTLCNMSIEAGARSGIIACDNKTIEYLEGRPFAPKGKRWEQAVNAWQDLHSDKMAEFDSIIELSVENLAPQITWGTSPEMVLPITGKVPNPENQEQHKRDDYWRALDYMGLTPGEDLQSLKPDRVFIGSCTNARIEDLRLVAKIVTGKKVANNIKQALIVPGSGLVKEQAESEGLADIFIKAGFEWRQPGCSMCLAMNADKLAPQERCASTSNRNFEGRQGQGGRTHLMSPVMAAASAIAGHFVDIRDFMTTGAE